MGDVEVLVRTSGKVHRSTCRYAANATIWFWGMLHPPEEWQERNVPCKHCDPAEWACDEATWKLYITKGIDPRGNDDG